MTISFFINFKFLKCVSIIIEQKIKKQLGDKGHVSLFFVLLSEIQINLETKLFFCSYIIAFSKARKMML